MLTYQIGSQELFHLSNELAIPNIKWMGIYPSEIESLDIKQLTLDKKDAKKLVQMMEREELSTAVIEELEILLTNQYKAEIEGILLNTSSNFLINDYLPGKFRQGLSKYF